MLHFAKICASGMSGVGIFDGNQIGLYGIGYLLAFGGFLFVFQFFSDTFFLGFCYLWGKYVFAFQNTGYARGGYCDLLMLFQ